LRGLQRIVQNSRFLILPWVKIPYLASSALSVRIPVIPTT
jgi:hypothetical protein